MIDKEYTRSRNLYIDSIKINRHEAPFNDDYEIINDFTFQDIGIGDYVTVRNDLGLKTSYSSDYGFSERTDGVHRAVRPAKEMLSHIGRTMKVIGSHTELGPDGITTFILFTGAKGGLLSFPCGMFSELYKKAGHKQNATGSSGKTLKPRRKRRRLNPSTGLM